MDDVKIDINDFQSGHLIVDANRTIVFCNTYVSELSGYTQCELTGLSISECVTKASNIFIDSYIFPELLTRLRVEENQINWLTKNKQRVPVIAHINLAESGVSYWSLYVSANRDKLQSELVNARSTLEQQAKELLDLATTDSLTGLMNRRRLLDLAEKTNSQMARNNSTYAVMSIDIDFFKKVNDTYGHYVGDEVLKGVASILSNGRRANDLVARIGGEEFVVVLPDIGSAHALELAEALRSKVESANINEVKLTISIGVTVSVKHNHINFEALMRLSDDALYEAKRRGRNRVSFIQKKHE
ncbi:GGDEF domain-containing protein [Glaciecola sp. XM2]|jgi:sigma-B regulation protein RsbQ|uniref:sensor domain-containing diguanylate cyclase n=1 Tax=Glaciecola sp. XM2 TaxID=1914931 RepID=UPI001BDE83EE|nr:sensor domain-containing diguanylate cyclase [Glaciecola sp. XM2]MBT1449545.1 GGDEF domain-containing protein [Glaciecola sp. XM2]